MTPFERKFLCMNPVIVLLVMNQPRGSTHHVQGRIWGISKQKLKAQSQPKILIALSDTKKLKPKCGNMALHRECEIATTGVLGFSELTWRGSLWTQDENASIFIFKTPQQPTKHTWNQVFEYHWCVFKSFSSNIPTKVIYSTKFNTACLLTVKVNQQSLRCCLAKFKFKMSLLHPIYTHLIQIQVLQHFSE